MLRIYYLLMFTICAKYTIFVSNDVKCNLKHTLLNYFFYKINRFPGIYTRKSYKTISFTISHYLVKHAYILILHNIVLKSCF